MGFSVLGFRGLGFEVQGAGLLRIEKGFDWIVRVSRLREFWVLVKELILRYHNREAKMFTIDPLTKT